MNRTDPVIVILNCEANPSSETVEIDRAQWNAMTPAERAKLVDEMATEHVNTSGGYGWHIADHDDEAMVGTATPSLPKLADNPAVLDAVQTWLASPNRPSGPVYASARDLIARIDAALTGKEA